jgi:rhamnosyltransferase
VTGSGPDENSVSVVVPTHNAGRQFNGLLGSLQNQTLRPVQTLVIDSESTDETVELAKSYGCKVVTIKRTDFNHGSARNLAVANSSTKYIVFLTQDAIPADEHMIAELIRPMQAEPMIAICYGRQLPRPDTHPLECFAREFNYPPQSMLKTKGHIATLGIKTFFCSNSCSAVRCSTFNKLGGFKNNTIVNEDMLFAAKAINAGYAVCYAAQAKVYHSHRYSLPGIFKRYFNIGRFFADNRWLLQQAGLKGYGLEMLRAGVKTLWQKRAPHYVAIFLVELAVKAIACKLGWYYQMMLHSFIQRPSTTTLSK